MPQGGCENVNVQLVTWHKRCFQMKFTHLIFSSSLFCCIFIELLIRLDSNFLIRFFLPLIRYVFIIITFEQVFNWSFRISDIWKNVKWHRRMNNREKRHEKKSKNSDQIWSLILLLYFFFFLKWKIFIRKWKDNKLSLKNLQHRLWNLIQRKNVLLFSLTSFEFIRFFIHNDIIFYVFSWRKLK
jgi:hypothetical protein